MKKFLFLLAIGFIFVAIISGGHFGVKGKGLVAQTIDGTSVSQDIPGVTLSISPADIYQGDPALITIDGIDATSTIKSLTFNNGKGLGIFEWKNKLSALVGIDARMKPGTYPLTLTLADGKIMQKDFIVLARTKVNEPFPIPDKLGGNTASSTKELINTLDKESAIMTSIPTSDQVLWTEPFGFPLYDPVVIDPYGMTRLNGYSTLMHKGTDFKADTGTMVLAINAGVVRYIDYLRDYGNTVVIDHGMGVQSFYLHLSQVHLDIGEKVFKGEIISSTGDTGFVLAPHLHLSIKINEISIDPEKFIALMGN